MGLGVFGEVPQTLRYLPPYHSDVQGSGHEDEEIAAAEYAFSNNWTDPVDLCLH